MSPLTFLVDTHVLYRWRADPKRLSRVHVRALTAAHRRNETVGVSSISLWELAMLGMSGRIRVGQPLEQWIEEMAGDPLFMVLPITPAIAAMSVGLLGLPRDPADRLIAATARCHNLTLLTADERILEWAGVSML